MLSMQSPRTHETPEFRSLDFHDALRVASNRELPLYEERHEKSPDEFSARAAHRTPLPSPCSCVQEWHARTASRRRA